MLLIEEGILNKGTIRTPKLAQSNKGIKQFTLLIQILLFKIGGILAG